MNYLPRNRFFNLGDQFLDKSPELSLAIVKEEARRAGTNYLWHPDFRKSARQSDGYQQDYDKFYNDPARTDERENEARLLQPFRQKESLSELLKRHPDKGGLWAHLSPGAKDEVTMSESELVMRHKFQTKDNEVEKEKPLNSNIKSLAVRSLAASIAEEERRKHDARASPRNIITVRLSESEKEQLAGDRPSSVRSAAVKALANRLAEEARQRPRNVITGRLSESEKEELTAEPRSFAPEGRPINTPPPGTGNIITVNFSENERRRLSSGGFDHNPQREAAIDDMLNMEGGYNNDPEDRGGETFRGIARNYWPKWPGWAQVDAAKAGGLTTKKEIDKHFADDEAMDASVRDFYRTNFWAPFADLPTPNNIAVKVFDTSVNAGQGGAVTILQKVINQMEPPEVLAIDGGLGPKTRIALKEVIKTAEDEALFRELFIQEQINHYQAVVKKYPKKQKFLGGWLRRAAWWPE